MLLKIRIVKKLKAYSNIYELIINWREANYKIFFSIVNNKIILIHIFNKQKEKYYDDSDIYFSVSENVLNARLEAGLTQFELAKRLNTKQSSISRLERGKELASLSFLLKIA